MLGLSRFYKTHMTVIFKYVITICLKLHFFSYEIFIIKKNVNTNIQKLKKRMKFLPTTLQP